MKGIFGEIAAFLAWVRLHAAGVVASLIFLRPPTMSLPRHLAEAPKSNQSPKIPFIPRSLLSRSLLSRRCAVSYFASMALFSMLGQLQKSLASRAAVRVGFR